MATDPKARLTTVSYEGGTATAPQGTIDLIFPGLKPSWKPDLKPSVGRRRSLYGTKQRRRAQAGTDIHVRFDPEGEWTVRVTGTYIDFITKVLAVAPPGKIVMAWTELGTIYGPQYYKV